SVGKRSWEADGVDAEPEVAAELEGPPAVPIPLPPGPLALRLLEVSFRYPGPGNPAALSRVSLEVPAGGRVAVVGPSGAGKSTLVHLLLRFWECQSGRLEVGGTDLRQIPLEQLRACFGVVPQRTHLFAGTVRQNLLLARPDAPPEALEAACRAARLHEVVQALPQGYDTWLGDRGFLLSGGERQRLAVARALLRRAPVLLLDEATAHLDGRTEAELLEDVLGLAGAYTLLVISHRLAGLERMDRIYFLERGSAAESGTHAELLARPGGRYRRFYDLERQGVVIA
ncbi:MAG: ABC transporter ATP-binding protein, partial [Gemmatimonadota bacterium]